MRLTHIDQGLREIHRTGNVCLDFNTVLPAEASLPLGVVSTTPAHASATSSDAPNGVSRVALDQVHPYSRTLSFDQSP